MRRGFGLVLGAGLVCVVWGCTTNPTTGRKQFNALSRDEEIKMGVDAKPEMMSQYGGEVKDPALRQYISEVGTKLSKQTEGDYPSLPWEFTLLDSDVINAFALPGGKVFMSRGLAEKLTNEAQLAGVLGHECGDVTARHINDRVAEQTGIGVVAAAAGAVVGSTSKNDAIRAAAPVAFTVGSQLVLLKFSRGQESEADYLGMRYMSKLMYDPKGQKQVMEILDRESGSERSAEMLSTHPDPKSRIAQVQKLLDGEFKATQNNPAYSLHEKEYHDRFLSKLPRTSPKKTDAGGRVFDLSRPSEWCAVCAAAERAGAEEERSTGEVEGGR